MRGSRKKRRSGSSRRVTCSCRLRVTQFRQLLVASAGSSLERPFREASPHLVRGRCRDPCRDPCPGCAWLQPSRSLAALPRLRLSSRDRMCVISRWLRVRCLSTVAQPLHRRIRMPTRPCRVSRSRLVQVTCSPAFPRRNTTNEHSSNCILRVRRRCQNERSSSRFRSRGVSRMRVSRWMRARLAPCDAPCPLRMLRLRQLRRDTRRVSLRASTPTLILILMRFLANSRPLFRRVPRFADQRARGSRYGLG